MASQYGVLTFDNRGPIKSWERMASIQQHNARSQPLPHCDPAGPKPNFLMGSSALVADAQQALRERGIDPHAIRANGVIAHEVILTASHEYFTHERESERMRRLWAWVSRAYLAAVKIWKHVVIVQMVLHQDEYTPHIHVVLMPLIQKMFRRREGDDERWTLNGREITGPGEFQRAHDMYAAELEPLGLLRGVPSNGRKYRPFADKAAEMDEVCKRAASAEADAKKVRESAEAVERQRAARWRAEFAALKHERTELEEDRLLLKLEQAKIERSHLRQIVTRQAQASTQIELNQRLANTVAAEAQAASSLAIIDARHADVERSLQFAEEARAQANTLLKRCDGLSSAKLEANKAAVVDAIGSVENAVAKTGARQAYVAANQGQGRW